MNDNGSDNGSVDIAVQPPNRDGAHVNPIIPAGIINLVRKSNYCVVARWEYRSTMWTDHVNAYMEAHMNALEPPELPTKQDFLLSDDPDRAENKSSFEYLIWGNHADSLQFLYETLDPLIHEQHQIEASIRRLVDARSSEVAALESTSSEVAALESTSSEVAALESTSSEVAALESTSIDEEETPANTNMSSEQLEIQRLKKELLMERRERIEAKQGQIEAKQGQIEALQGQIERTQGQIEAKQGQIKAIQGQIERTQGQIKAIQGQVSEQLRRIKGNQITLRTTLLWLAAKGNETAGGGSMSISRDNMGRINSSTPELTSVDAQNICDAEPDQAFLNDLLNKAEIQGHIRALEELRKFVIDLKNRAQIYTKYIKKKHAKQKEKQDMKIKATVDAILRWEPGVTVESLGQVNVKFAFPPLRGCETSADQPILGAIICRMLTILRDSSLTLCSEQVLPSHGNKDRGRRIDFVVDVYKEFLNVIYPEMLGTVIEVKTVEENDDIKLSNQRKGREQVLGHQAKQLHCSSTFGGIGQVDIAWGIVSSLKSVQVLVMKLELDPDGVLKLSFRQTKQVPFLDEGGNGDGFVLLASALLEVRKKSTFGDGGELSIEDMTANDRRKILSLLGSGGFAHVVKLADNEFMKIPRSQRMETSLQGECNILHLLNGGDNQDIPRIMPWGVSEVKLAISNEISEMKVLRLTGIVGHSLGSSGLLMAGDHVHAVIKRVYDALEYAHGKGVFHMDVRPSNIIVKWNESDEWDVLLSDWGCAMLESKEIKKNGFVGCLPYAHDYLLKRHEELMPNADFDFASLGYTWYYVINKKLAWHFDRQLVPIEKLELRGRMMTSFFQDIGTDTAAMVPKVRDFFAVCPPDRTGKKRKLDHSIL